MVVDEHDGPRGGSDDHRMRGLAGNEHNPFEQTDEEVSFAHSFQPTLQTFNPSPALSESPVAPSSTGPPINGFEDERDQQSSEGSSVAGKTIRRVNTHERKPSTLSLDTGMVTSEPQARVSTARTPSLSPVSSRWPMPSSSKLPLSKSPLSPRTRDRGFSLRKSLLSRNVHGTPPVDGSIIELQPAESSQTRQDSSQAVHNGRPSKKPDAVVTVSPLIEDVDDVDRRPKSIKKPPSPSPLPHYETWVQSKAARFGLLTRLRAFKEGVRKKILQIHEIPPSKNGRHIDLNPIRNKALIDERTGREYINNTIRSSRYSLYNFLPRQLYAQFSKLANFYFLCVSILQMIPGLSTTGTYTTIIPLAFFVTISMAKEGYDDLRRYRLDKAENNKTAYVLNARGSSTMAVGEGSGDNTTLVDGTNHWTKTKWEDVRVGDVVRLARDEAAPADLVVLQASGPEEIAYIETMALDGETNLKSRQASPPLKRVCKTVDGIARCTAHLVVEDPNLDLYNFEGRVTVANETLPLTNNEIAYRGSVLRNTTEMTGMAVYTGEECKIRMNATKNPRIKAPSLQAVVNKVVIILVIFVFALAIFNTVAYQIWQETTEEKSWYLTNANVAFFPILVSFIILFNTMIPLSLYVSLEIVKLFQMLLMNDIDMYDEDTNTPMEARTSTINEELGQVNYIFSDKTGTLTNNSMRFRKMSIAGTAWLHDPDIQEEALKEAAKRPPLQKRRSKGKKPMRRKISTSSAHETSVEPGISPISCGSPVARNESTTSRWKSSARPRGSQPDLGTTELLQYIQQRPHTLFARKVRFFLLSLALCHTCFPEMNKDGEIEYQAVSPDEQALVRAAQELGYIVIDRQNTTITVKTFPAGPTGESIDETYEILDVIEFTSNRKRMSVIVRTPNHRICVFCKGADSILIQLLRLSGLAFAKAIEVEQRVGERQSLEAQEAIRRSSEAWSPKDTMIRRSMSVHRSSLGGIARRSTTTKRLQPIRDEVDHWLRDRETDMDMSPLDNDSIHYSPRPSAHYGQKQFHSSMDGRFSFQGDDRDELVEESLVVDDSAVFERCFQHINDFATEGLRTLLYGYRYIEEDEYNAWKKIYLDASTSLVNRQEMVEKAGAMVERDLELAGATAIEDKLQRGVPEAIDKLRRAKIKLWMLTGDKRETAINIGHSCRLIKDYSSITILDHELGDVSQSIAAATLDINSGFVAHSVVVIDGHTLSQITVSESLRKLFLDLAILVDTVICCRASPSQKASLVSSIRHKVNHAITLAIGDGANDIAMIQEAHVGIGITGKEGLQAARTSDYSIAQFRFLTKLLLVHGRWNYIRTCKYTLGTFWKEFLFYLTQALYQRFAGYTGTSLYESWSLSMFNTLFTSLPVIFLGIFEQDLTASTLLAVPELYHSLGHRNGGFSIPIYLAWVALASCYSVIVFFIMLGLYGQALFTTDNSLYAMGALTFTACIIVIASKIQFWELHNKTYTCAISMFISIGGWFLWNIILSSTYSNNTIYDVKEGFLERFGRNALWWLTLILIVTACWALEIGVKVVKRAWLPSDADLFRELEQDPQIKSRFEQAARIGLVRSAHFGAGEDQEAINALKPVRTAEEDRQREGEVQDMLDRPRHSRVASGPDLDIARGDTVRRRQHSEPEVKVNKVSFAVEQREDDGDDDDSDADGKHKMRRKSSDVQELLRRGFGSVRRSLDIV